MSFSASRLTADMSSPDAVDRLAPRAASSSLISIELRVLVPSSSIAMARLAVPGMPLGSPGMEGPTSENYAVLLFHEDGSTTLFARH